MSWNRVKKRGLSGWGLAVLVLAQLGIGSAAFAQTVGPVTNLPLPRFVSMKAEEGFVRRGPSKTNRVDWVFKREDMPLEITAEYGNWRRVRDVDGVGGWMHYSLLSGVRTVIVQKDYTPLRSKAELGSDPNAYAEQGVIAYLKECIGDWCRITAGGAKRLDVEV